MESVKFIMPEVYNNLTASGNPKSKNTINLYKVHLNKIARATGLTTIQEFIKGNKKVIKAIKDLTPINTNESELAHKSRIRIYYSSLFMVLPKAYMESSNPFYKAFQNYKDQYEPATI